MRPQATTVHLQLSDPTADTAVLELLTQQLRRLLMTLDVGPAWREPADGGQQPTTIDLVDAGSMRISIVASRAALRALVEMVRTWVAREERVAVTLRAGEAGLTILGAAASDRAHNIDRWVQRAMAGPPSDDIWYR